MAKIIATHTRRCNIRESYYLDMFDLHPDSEITVADSMLLSPFESATAAYGTELKKGTPPIPKDVPVSVFYRNASVGGRSRVFWKPL